MAALIKQRLDSAEDPWQIGGLATGHDRVDGDFFDRGASPFARQATDELVRLACRTR
jgi:hypothetical protein